MLWRISAALVALSLVHGSENVARDSARLASEIRQEVPQAMVAACVDKPEVCQQVLKQVGGQVSGLAGANAAPHIAPQPARLDNPGLAGIKAPPVPVASGEFPLPPVRPASMPHRKGT